MPAQLSARRTGCTPLASVRQSSQSYRWSCQDSVRLSVSGLVDSVLKAVGTAAKVVSIVA
ncbi:hypothetical protein [Nonomuraea sp. NPDC049784]|uniref:hypothetical protein n=1 Tax=Nonomuraea sp. NPDC049784 TaxID=3154361 RepID=UPI0033E80B98